MVDELPSSEDMDQFSHQTGYCPECGEEIWDEAYACPHCDAVVEGNVVGEGMSREGARIGFRTVLVLVTILVVVLLMFLFRLV
jgi:hypothetical protein